jgi:hypothetical protein
LRGARVQHHWLEALTHFDPSILPLIGAAQHFRNKVIMA